MSDDEREEKELDLTSRNVVTKYKSAAKILSSVQTGNMYKNVKRKIEMGVAFPTCISINNTVCHFSPLASDETMLEEGDILKIDMACHIDGFIAAVAHTHVLQEGPVTGRAAEVALRLGRPGRKAESEYFWHNCPKSYIPRVTLYDETLTKSYGQLSK